MRLSLRHGRTSESGEIPEWLRSGGLNIIRRSENTQANCVIPHLILRLKTCLVVLNYSLLAIIRFGVTPVHIPILSLPPSLSSPGPRLRPPRADFARFRTRSRDKRSATAAVTSVQRSCTYVRFMRDTRLQLRAPVNAHHRRCVSINTFR